MEIRRLFLFGTLLLAACNSVSYPAPPVKNPQIWRVKVSPSLSWLGPHLRACALEESGFGVALDMDGEKEPDVSFDWGDQAADKKAFLLGWDDLVLVVHPANSQHTFTMTQVGQIISGQVSKWEDLDGGYSGKIDLLFYARGVDIRAKLDDAYGVTTVAADAFMFSEPGLVKQEVSQNTAAIGFLPLRWVDTSVRMANVQDAPAGAFRQPILAVTAAEPEGALKNWLACIQQQIAIP